MRKSTPHSGLTSTSKPFLVGREGKKRRCFSSQPSVLGFDQVTRLCVAASPLYRPCWDFFGGFSVRRLGAQVRKIARRGGPDSSPTGPQIGRVCDPTARWPAVCRPPQSPLTVSLRAAPN